MRWTLVQVLDLRTDSRPLAQKEIPQASKHTYSADAFDHFRATLGNHEFAAGAYPSFTQLLLFGI